MGIFRKTNKVKKAKRKNSLKKANRKTNRKRKRRQSSNNRKGRGLFGRTRQNPRARHGSPHPNRPQNPRSRRRWKNVRSNLATRSISPKPQGMSPLGRNSTSKNFSSWTFNGPNRIPINQIPYQILPDGTKVPLVSGVYANNKVSQKLKDSQKAKKRGISVEEYRAEKAAGFNSNDLHKLSGSNSNNSYF